MLGELHINKARWVPGACTRWMHCEQPDKEHTCHLSTASSRHPFKGHCSGADAIIRGVADISDMLPNLSVNRNNHFEVVATINCIFLFKLLDNFMYTKLYRWNFPR
jgi:hypothetical protein